MFPTCFSWLYSALFMIFFLFLFSTLPLSPFLRSLLFFFFFSCHTCFCLFFVFFICIEFLSYCVVGRCTYLKSSGRDLSHFFRDRYYYCARSSRGLFRFSLSVFVFLIFSSSIFPSLCSVRALPSSSSFRCPEIPLVIVRAI